MRRKPTAPVSALDAARIRAGLTVGALAVATGAHRATVCRWLSGERRPHSPAQELLARALGLGETERCAMFGSARNSMAFRVAREVQGDSMSQFRGGPESD